MGITVEELRKLCGDGAIKWTAHILARLQERGIQPSDIKHCISTGRIIEQYPDDYPFPSCLVLGETINNRVLHVVIGVGQGFLWLVTAYYPDADSWSTDFSHRRENQ